MNDCRQREVENCSFVKTCLMLSVVLYHSILFWNGTWFGVEPPVFRADALVIIAEWFNTFHIYGFALVSGYLFCFLKYEQGKYKEYIPFLKNKAKRLLVPFTFASTCWVVPIACYFFSYGWRDVVKRYILATSPNQLWFILMLFDVFVVFWILSDFFYKRDKLGLLLVLTAYVLNAKIPNVFQIGAACKYLVFFWIGFKMRQYGSTNIRKIHPAIWFFADIMLLVVQTYLSHNTHPAAQILSDAMLLIVHLVGAVMAFVILQKIADIVDWKHSTIFSLLSKHSMVIYLFHQQVIYFFIIWFNGVVNPYLNAAINFVGSLVISMILAALLMRFRWTRFLVGEK